MNIYARYLFLTLLIGSGPLMAEDYIVADGDVGLTRAEVEFLATKWAPAMQQAAANDEGEMIEILNNELVNIKIASEADKLPPDLQSETYWTYVHSLRLTKRRYVMAHFMDNLDMPDMAALAEERYHTEKDKYALITEHRLASHILILCKVSECDRIEKRKVAEEALAELEAGADWDEMVKKYSGDPGSKDKGGRFAKWLVKGIPKVDPHFVGGVFSIDEVGGYSDLVDTQFGIHIIRLDQLRPAFYRSYEEVREQIIADLENNFRNLAAKDFDARYIMTSETHIDMEAMDEILAPYVRKSGVAPAGGPLPRDEVPAVPAGIEPSSAAPASAQEVMEAAKAQIKAATGQ